MTIEHHQQIEAGFDAVKAAAGADARRAAQKQLALILTGHSLAEEVVLYPAMALSDQKAHSGEAYTEQSAAKVQLAALDDLEPASKGLSGQARASAGRGCAPHPRGRKQLVRLS